MKTTALVAPDLSYKPRVKKLLARGIIYLTSKNFTIFVGVIVALMSYAGVLFNDKLLIGYGAVAFLLGFLPWATRVASRHMRQDKLGLINDK